MFDGQEREKMEKLVKIAGMLGSSSEQERATAAAYATSILHSMNLTWEDVMRGIGARPAPPKRQWKPYEAKSHDYAEQKSRLKVFEGLEAHDVIDQVYAYWEAGGCDGILGSREIAFLRSLKEQNWGDRGMSEAQWRWLLGIVAKLKRKRA